MHRLALFVLPALAISTPAVSADLGPYPQRDTYYHEPTPPPVVRERIIVRRYYEPAPYYAPRVLYPEPRVYYAPRVYAGAYYPRPYAYAYAGWRPRYFYPRGAYWHHRHHGW